jgi:hypothetical protein
VPFRSYKSRATACAHFGDFLESNGFLKGAKHGRSGLITKRNPGLYALLQISIVTKGDGLIIHFVSEKVMRERMLSDDTQFTTKQQV